MRRSILALFPAMILLATPALAREPEGDKPEQPITQKDVSAGDVVATPATDLNLRKDEIPALLIEAQERPYALRGVGTCQQIGAEIGRFDAVLGDDIDLPQVEGRRTSPGRMAQSVIGAFIPFRGLIREISGANAHDRQLQAAILAGVARRSFLKGIGQGKGCRYPARSATLEVFNRRMAALNADEVPPKARATEAEPVRAQRSEARDTRREADSVRYVSRPVVQGTN